MSQGYDTPNTGSGGDDLYEGAVKVNLCLGALNTHNLGGSYPATVMNGMIVANDTVATNYTLWLRQNDAWVQLDVKAALPFNKDFNNYQALSFRLENVSSTPAAQATTVGRLVFNTVEGRPLVDNNDVTAGFDWLITSRTIGELCHVPIDISTFELDNTNPPTKKTKGSSPVVKGYEFDATNEKASLKWRVPDNWISNSNIYLNLFWMIDQVEGSGDNIDTKVTWISLVPASGKASRVSTITFASTDIGSGTSDGTIHKAVITIDYDDSDNPVSVGDLMVFEVSRPNLSEVGGAILTYADVTYYRNEL